MTGWEQAILAYTCFVVVHLPQIWAETRRLSPRRRVVRTPPPSPPALPPVSSAAEIRAGIEEFCEVASATICSRMEAMAPIPGVNTARYSVAGINGVDATVRVDVQYTVRADPQTHVKAVPHLPFWGRP